MSQLIRQKKPSSSKKALYLSQGSTEGYRGGSVTVAKIYYDMIIVYFREPLAELIHNKSGARLSHGVLRLASCSLSPNLGLIIMSQCCD